MRKCLPDEYKQQKKRNRGTEQYAEQSAANEEKSVPEQQAMTVNTEGYEEAFEDVNRPNVESAAEIVCSLA